MTITIIFLAFLVMLAIMLAGMPIAVVMAVMGAVGGVLTFGEVTIDNIAKNSSQVTSSLMNVEMESYEVTYSRADTGTLLPPPMA